jgi:hypothetical protein
VRIAPRSLDRVVYTAEENLFSAYGEWRVSRAIDCDPFRRIEIERFCVRERDPVVRLGLVDGTLRIDPTLRCSTVAAVAAAHLGHEPAPSAAPGAAGAAATAAGPRPPARDQARLGGSDHYRFEGQAGDTVELTLERDGGRGSAGELARLSLREENGGGLDRLEGAVPLELEVTLPASGHYVIEVADGSGGEAFRGHYHLRVTSTSDEAVLLEPLDSVEP